MLLFAFLACADPPIGKSEPLGGDDTGTVDTGEDAPTCPGWSGLVPGTRTLRTTAEWEAQTGTSSVWIDIVTLEGDVATRSRQIDDVRSDGESHFLFGATFRCDADGAWIQSETYALDAIRSDGTPYTLDLAWEWSPPFLYYPATLETGMNLTETHTYTTASGATDLESSFVVHGAGEVETRYGTVSAWDVTVWDEARTWYAEPYGAVENQAYALEAYTEAE